MVVLMESPGVTLKRKGAEEPGLFMCPGDGDGDGDGFPLSCRATKIRRLVSADHHHDVAAVASVGTGGDVMMGEASSPAVADEEGAVVVYDPACAGRGRLGLLGQWRLRPWAPLRDGAEWIRDMLREADSRTVRAVLSSAQEEGDDMALVPWGAAPAPASTEASRTVETVDGEDTEETAEMDVEEERGHRTQPFGASCGEGYLYRWPHHCMAPSQLPAVSQASLEMWSW